MNVPTEGYLKGLREWCDENNILLIFDEVQTGMGRLGSLWGYERFDVEPDVMTSAKGLGNGVPIGAFMCKDSCDVLEPGDHGSTFGGNVLTTAAGNATVRYMVENDVPGTCAQGRRVSRIEARRDAERAPGCGEGLSRHGIADCVAACSRRLQPAVVAAGNNEGVLLNPVLPDAIRFMPPLIITEADVDECMEKLNSAIDVAVAG